MQIRVSTRDCRAAVGKAIQGLKEGIEVYKCKVTETSFESLLNGAVANGLAMTEALKKEMREMTDRDVEHMMKQHPAYETLGVLNNFIDMLAYHKGDDIVIDDQDFNLLKAHLPTASADSDAVAA